MSLAFALWMAAGCVPHLTSPEDSDTDSTDAWVAPENDWPSSEPPEGLVGEGFEVGEIVPDFRLSDQFAQTVALWQFYGNVIVLDVSTMWCAPCQALAATTEETSEDYETEGFIYVTVLAQDVEGDAPDQADLEAWASTFGITSPILSDPDGAYSNDALALTSNQYPVLLVIDREMRVASQVSPPEDPELRAAIEAEL